MVYAIGQCDEKIIGYTNSDLTSDPNDRKSTGGMEFYINVSMVTWSSQKQKTVALSSYEVEFMVVVAMACQALWLLSLIDELRRCKPKPVTLFVDNKSAIGLMKNPVLHGCNKHIDTRFHFSFECVDKRKIKVEFMSTGE